MAAYRLAALIKGISGEDFLVVRQTPPPPLPEEEYAKYVDSDLWDLPSAPLRPLEDGCPPSKMVIEGADSCSDKLDLSKFDLDSALTQVMSQVGIADAIVETWLLFKYVEEPDFGPDHLVHTLFILGRREMQDILQDSCKWISKDYASKLLLDVKPGSDRLGPFVVISLLPDSAVLGKWRAPRTLNYQVYPPGITLIPMSSRTREPFRTTNVVVMVPDNVINRFEDSTCIAYGDALLMDPGCCSQYHEELVDLVTSLPRKLLVFVTHHHYDHVDGLSVVKKCNPDAILLAHENTVKRIKKEALSLDCMLISGCERICIGGEQLEAIFAPGHTDGHLALLHVSTHSLIVGDHCVGKGSAVLDIRAGGNMKDYFQTTYKFLELSPHVLIPMHGRINLWPKRMLCGYLKHRRDRELSILKAIESGAQTLYDILAKSYADVDVKLWLPASSNVRIHVDHLAYQEKLPEDFSIREFRASCRLHFVTRWILQYTRTHNLSALKVLVAVIIGGLATSFAIKTKQGKN